MTPTATEQEVRDILDRVRKLPPEVREDIAHELLDELEPAGPQPFTSEAVRLAWKEEIARRIAAYERGELVVMTAEEVMAQLEADQQEDERHAG